jgi:hypothetical protein
MTQQHQPSCGPNRILRFLAILFFALVAICSSSRAQDSIDLSQLQLVPSNAVPRNAVFWLLSTYDVRQFGPPLPFNPFAWRNPDIYALPPEMVQSGGTNAFLIDDLAIQQERADQRSASLSRFSTMSDDEESSDDESSGGASVSYPSNTLWLEVTDRSAVTNGWLGLTVHGYGYEPSGLVEMKSSSEGNWQGRMKLQYFVRLAEGKYARILLDLMSHNGSLRIQGFTNPSGSRNLEYDPQQAAQYIR